MQQQLRLVEKGAARESVAVTELSDVPLAYLVSHWRNAAFLIR